MSTINVVYSPSAPTFPAGTVVASIAINVTNPDATVTPLTTTPDQASVSYNATQVGAYSVTVQAVDSAGNLLGTAVSTTFSVAAPQTVSLSLPSAVSVTP